MNTTRIINHRTEVEKLITHDAEPAILRPTGAPTRDQLPQLADRATIAVKSLRSQWRTFFHLGTHERMAISQLRVYGPMPMSELAARISLSRAAVTSLIDRLEATGWVKRHPDERDRRRTVLSLLPQSADELGSVTQDWHSELLEWSRSMSDEEWRIVSSFLGRFTDIAERRATELRATAPERALS